MRIKRPGAEAAVAKVQCQECGGHKLFGHRCDAPVEGGLCGWPQVSIRSCDDGGILVFMPLCPSTNAREGVVRMGKYARKILTAEARDYIASVAGQLSPLISQAIKGWAWKPVTTWRVVWTWVILPRTTCDPHNYWKVSLDTLERAGVFFDDRYALPRLGGIWFDSKNPGMVFKL